MFASTSISMCFTLCSISPQKCISLNWLPTVEAQTFYQPAKIVFLNPEMDHRPVSGGSSQDKKHHIFSMSLNATFRLFGRKKFRTEPQRSNNNHITTGNDTTSTQLLGIRPTLISCVCVVTLKNKQLHQQQKNSTTDVLHYNQARMLFSLSVHLSIHTVFSPFQITPRGS